MQQLAPVTEDARSATQAARPMSSSTRVMRVLGGRYRVRSLLGRGGMGNVFLGDDRLLERSVAIKILHTHLASDSSGLERFRREAMTLAAVRSPHVVAIYDIGLDGQGVFLVMQHLDGRTLEEEIASIGPMSLARAASVLIQLLDGLAEMHALGLVHRDIKPSNVILDADDHVVLLDLGIALDPRHAPLTAPGMVAGTPGYLAPESLTRAESDYTSDVYQVGLLLLFLLTGVDLARQHSESGVEDLVKRLPGSFAGLARRALAADPSERFPSAPVMREALEAAVGPSVAVSSKHVRARTARSEQHGTSDDRKDVGQSRGPATGPSRSRAKRTTTLKAAQVVLDANCFDTARPTRTRLPTVRSSEALRAKILIVDEDAAFCGTLHRKLKGHDSLVVDSPERALALLEGGARVDVILCGLPAPMTFYAAVGEICPAQAASIIFISGAKATREARAFFGRMTNACLAKPFEVGHLKRLIEERLVSKPPSRCL